MFSTPGAADQGQKMGAAGSAGAAGSRGDHEQLTNLIEQLKTALAGATDGQESVLNELAGLRGEVDALRTSVRESQSGGGGGGAGSHGMAGWDASPSSSFRPSRKVHDDRTPQTPPSSERQMSPWGGGGRRSGNDDERRTAVANDSDLQKALRFVTKHQANEIFGQRDGVTLASFDQSRMSHRHPVNQKKDPHPYMVRPTSIFRFTWDLVSMFLIVFIAFTLPFRIAFVSEWSLSWEVIDFLIDLWFILDIVLNFATGYIDATGKLILSKRKIAINYLRSWFLLDFLATLPLDWFLETGLSFRPPPETSTAGGEQTAQLFSMLRLFKLLKLLRLLRVAKLLKQLKKIEDGIVAALSLHSHSVFSLFKLLVMLLTFAHWNGCIQFYVSETVDTIAMNGTRTELHESSWIVRGQLQNLEPFEQWSWSYYHAMVQLLAIGEGLVPPRRLSEVWTFLLSILLGASLYAIFVASLTSVLGELGAASRKYRARIDNLGEYMRHSSMPNELRQKLLAYYERAYPGRLVLDDNQISAEVSHPLRFRVALHHCHDVLESLQVLHDERLSRAVASSLTREVFVDEDVIIHEGEEGRGMYFILEGAVDVLRPKALLKWERKMKKASSAKGGTAGASDRTTSKGKAERAQRWGDTKARTERWTSADLYLANADVDDDTEDGDDGVLTTLVKRAFFGEMALISQHGVAVASVRASGYAETYHLSSNHYAKVLERFPHFKQYVEAVAKLRIANYASVSSEEHGNESFHGLGGRKARTRDELIKRTEDDDVNEMLKDYSEGKLHDPLNA